MFYGVGGCPLSISPAHRSLFRLLPNFDPPNTISPPELSLSQSKSSETPSPRPLSADSCLSDGLRTSGGLSPPGGSRRHSSLGGQKVSENPSFAFLTHATPPPPSMQKQKEYGHEALREQDENICEASEAVETSQLPLNQNLWHGIVLSLSLGLSQAVVAARPLDVASSLVLSAIPGIPRDWAFNNGADRQHHRQYVPGIGKATRRLIVRTIVQRSVDALRAVSVFQREAAHRGDEKASSILAGNADASRPVAMDPLGMASVQTSSPHMTVPPAAAAASAPVEIRVDTAKGDSIDPVSPARVRLGPPTTRLEPVPLAIPLVTAADENEDDVGEGAGAGRGARGTRHAGREGMVEETKKMRLQCRHLDQVRDLFALLGPGVHGGQLHTKHQV